MAAENNINIDVGIIPKIDSAAYDRELAKVAKKALKIRGKLALSEGAPSVALERSAAHVAQRYQKVAGFTKKQSVNALMQSMPPVGSSLRAFRTGVLARVGAAEKQEKATIKAEQLAQERQRAESTKRTRIAKLDAMLASVATGSLDEVSEQDQQKIIRQAAKFESQVPVGETPTGEVEQKTIELANKIKSLSAEMGAAASESERYQKTLEKMSVRDAFDTPLGRVQEKVRTDTEKKARADAEKNRAIMQEQLALAKFINQNIHRLVRLSEADKSKIRSGARRIEAGLAPGESPATEREKTIVDAAQALDKMEGAVSKTMARVSSLISALTTAGKFAYKELTREAKLLGPMASIRDYRFAESRWLSYMGVQNPDQVLSDIGSFNDRFRLGDISEGQMQGFAMFGRETFAQLRRDPKDIRALLAAFKNDMARGEAAGWTRQEMARRMGMSDLLPTLLMPEEDAVRFWEWAQSGDFQQQQALQAYRNSIRGKNTKESVMDWFSANKVGATAGGGVGALAGGIAAGAAGWKIGMAAGSLVAPGVGTVAGGLLGLGLGALGGTAAGLLGAGVGAAGQDVLGLSSDGNISMTTNINITMDADAARIMKDGGSYVNTFESLASISNIS